jgi:two-component system, chemotaxis family, response regulator Rcp1
MDHMIKILLVEDNEADADLIRENLGVSKILNHLDVVADGIEALAFLRREGKYAHAGRPDLMLLDLNLPRKDGREVLIEMKADAALKRIPVVILTSSQAETDIVKSYDLQASAYVNKPVDLAGFGKIIKGIENFWFSVVRYPPEK